MAADREAAANTSQARNPGHDRNTSQARNTTQARNTRARWRRATDGARGGGRLEPVGLDGPARGAHRPERRVVHVSSVDGSKENEMSRSAVIEVRELAKTYNTGVTALDGVTFDVNAGEIFGYLGRNGAGKSTTVRILNILLRPTGGSVSVGGYDVVSQPSEVRRIIGVVLQGAGIDDLMTGREHLVLAARLLGSTKAAAHARAEELLEAFGPRLAADRLAARYSGGMRRRLAVAMALVRRPPVLFLDEPTTGLDPQSRRAFWTLIRQLRSEGSAVFLTTQYLAEAEEDASHLPTAQPPPVRHRACAPSWWSIVGRRLAPRSAPERRVSSASPDSSWC